MEAKLARSSVPPHNPYTGHPPNRMTTYPLPAPGGPTRPLSARLRPVHRSSAAAPKPLPGARRTPAQPVAVAVLSDDRMTGQGAIAYLSERPDMRVLPGDRPGDAEVVLILVGRVTEETLGWIQQAAEQTERPEPAFVLVCNGIAEQQLLRAVGRGLVSVVPRRRTDLDHIAKAVLNARDGRMELPGDAIAWMSRYLRAVERDVLEPSGLTASGLASREVDVLRLLSEGHDTVAIAGRLNYSERTVKNILQGLTSRLKLRNRTHAVAFAVRAGVL